MKRSRHIPVKSKRRAMRRAAGTCQVRWPGCEHGISKPEYHHRFPFGEGGSHRSANLVMACRHCHEAIHWRDPGRAKVDGLLLIQNPWRRWRAYWETRTSA